MIDKFKKIIAYWQEQGFRNTVRWLYNCLLYKIRSSRTNSTDFDSIKNSKEEEKYAISKEGVNVFIVASIPYYDIGGGQRCSQLAKTFNKMSYNVHYLYAFKSSESTVFNLSMPMSSHQYISNKTVEKLRTKVKKDDLFIFEAPSPKFAPILDLAIECDGKIIYENIDNWETSLGSTVYDEETLKRLLTHADLLVGTAKPLVEQLKTYIEKYKIKDKEILYLPNAVDDELFCGLKDLKKPEDLVTDKKTFLYYGSLWGEWFDWDLIIDLAIKYPRYSFNIIGDDSKIPNIKKNCPYNVHFLGLKKQVELPNYLKHVDYTMIPFKTGEIGDYVSPLKVFEYIAMYTNVLTTSLPDVKGYPNLYCGDSAKEWAKIVEVNHEVDRKAADSFIENNTWSSRVSEMINALYKDKNKSMFKDKLSIVILNYNNKNIIFKSLESLIKFNDIYNYEIIVVDNGSTDGSYEQLKEEYSKKIKLVKNSKNGCSSGRNLGVSHSKGEYIMFLDSDQWITNKYWLEPYETILKNNSEIGLIGWAAGFFNNKGFAYHVVDSFPYRFMPSNKLCRRDISYLGSGGMIVKKSVFDEVSGFDESYDPTCYEDTDFTLKVRNTGREIVYCPYLGIIHLPHQTTNSGSEEHQKLTNQKKAYFHNKWSRKNPKLLKLHIK